MSRQTQGSCMLQRRTRCENVQENSGSPHSCRSARDPRHNSKCEALRGRRTHPGWRARAIFAQGTCQLRTQPAMQIVRHLLRCMTVFPAEEVESPRYEPPRVPAETAVCAGEVSHPVRTVPCRGLTNIGRRSPCSGSGSRGMPKRLAGLCYSRDLARHSNRIWRFTFKDPLACGRKWMLGIR